jgi:hypothetical protein
MATIANDTQFIGISPTIDLTGKKSAILNEQTIPVTMDDITSTVRPYKVFTALLTQSGGGNQSSLINQPLTIGVTYWIVSNGTNNYDFTNVGAPNNNDGTYFVATGTTPTAWGVAELNYNIGAPVATVLENTIGNVTWIYNGVGEYVCNLENAFPINKTIYNKNYQFISLPDIDDKALVLYSNLNLFFIYTLSYDLTTPKDNVLFNTPIEIRVYE